MTKHLSRLKIKCVSDVEKRDIKGKKRQEKKGDSKGVDEVLFKLGDPYDYFIA
jgi:hypothetical protein